MAGLRLFVLALLSVLLVGCGGGGSGPPNPEPPGNEAPFFTSSTTASVNENQTAAYTAVATDPDGDALTYSLEGTDTLFFSIDENTGVVSFRNAPDCENPGDVNGDGFDDLVIGSTPLDQNKQTSLRKSRGGSGQFPMAGNNAVLLPGPGLHDQGPRRTKLIPHAGFPGRRL